MPCWAEGIQMRDGKSSELLSTALGTPILHKPQRMSASSWSLAPRAASAVGTQARSWPLLMMTFFFMLPCSASTIAQHPGWAPALKVRSRFLGAFSHHEAVPCIISKVWYLLPMPPDWRFLFGPAAWHALAKNPGQLHSPSRWLCFEYCKFKHLSHYDSNRSGAGMNVLLMPRRGFSQSYYKYHVAILYPTLEDQHKWKRVSDYRRGRQGHDFHVEEGEVPHQTPPLCGGSRFKC